MIVDNQELDPEVQLVLKLLEMAHEPELAELSAQQARQRVARDAARFEGPKFAVERVEELQLAGNEASLSARLYVPPRHGIPAAASRGGDPALVYYHGGGFVVCDLETHDNTCRFLAAQSDTKVISVDYRLAPENRFPAAHEDAVAAFRAVVARADELGIDRRRVAVGGDSAGGNLAAGVAQATAADPGGGPAFQMLLYPWLDLSHKRRSYELFRKGFYLTEADLDWYGARYLGEDGDPRDPRCSPLLADDLGGIAPAYIATAGFDPLRDEGEDYGRRLLDAGVPVALHRQAPLIHGFANTIGFGTVGRHAMTQAAGALRVGLAPRPGTGGDGGAGAGAVAAAEPSATSG